MGYFWQPEAEAHVCEKCADVDYGDFWQSPEHLVFAEGRTWIARLQVYRDDGFPDDGSFLREWIMAGRDAYKIRNVTHWRYLPGPPAGAAE
jgi:hypothetical protein